MLAGLAALGGAIFVRFYRLGDLPPGLHGDEAAHGLEALRIGQEGWIGVWSPVALGQPAGPLYFFAAFVNAFPEEIWSLRIGAAIVGLATLPLFFLFCRQLFGRRAALFGTFMLAFSLWHVHYSRIAFPVNALPLMEILTLWLLFAGLDRNRLDTRRFWLLGAAGLAFGATAYTYSMFLAFLAIVVLVWVRELLSRERPWRQTMKGGVVFLAAAVIIALPYMGFVAGHQDEMWERAKIVSMARAPEYEEQEGIAAQSRFVLRKVVRAGSLFFIGHKRDASDGAGYSPLLDPLTGSLVALGLVLSLRKLGDRRHFLVFLGVTVTAVGTALTLEWGENRRLMASLPFVFAAAGYSLDRLVALMEGRVGWRGRQAVLALALGFVIWHNTATYFNEYTGSDDHDWIFGHRLVEAASQLKELDGQPYVYFYSPRWSIRYETVRYLFPEVRGEDRSREFGDFSVERDQGRGDVLYLAMPSYADVLTQAQELYPGGELFEARDDGELLFAWYRVGGEK